VMQVAAIRMLGLLSPMTVALAAWLVQRPRGRAAGAIFLGVLWTLPALLAVNLVALRMQWWRFTFQGGGLLGIPVDLLIGWCILWGALPSLLLERARLWTIIVVMGALDGLLMPLSPPVVLLNAGWLWGEALAIGVALIPAQLLARWTAANRRLGWRATLQAFVFAGVTLFVVPAMLVEQTGGSWAPLLDLPSFARQILMQLGAVAAVIGLSAVQELAERGEGTPFPFDPPKRLVRSGLYAYVSNPMQLSAVLFYLLLAVALRSGWFVAGAAILVAYSSGFASWSERDELTARWGDDWLQYRAAVRAWIPRWRPAVFGVSRLYVDTACNPCSRIGTWVAAQKPLGLELVPATLHPTMDLRRIRYEAADGTSADGIAAVARAFEHFNLLWALAGGAARLPLVRPLLQLIIDGVGGGPALVVRSSK
jgi:protein-S-isoprenylcysteine O-methyltransferase Ste14